MDAMKDSARKQTPGQARAAGPTALRARLARLRPSVPQAWQERFNAFWSARNPREQAILAGGGAVLVLVIGYTLLWEPAAEGRQRVARGLPQMRADLAEMATLAQEARGLKATPAPALRGDALTQALQDSLGQHGLKAARLAAGADNNVQVQLDKVPFGAFSSWLQDVRQQQRMKVIDARIVYVGATALVNVSATLQGPGGRS
ncbi:type II secretion system protein M [Cupriavidus oxalaticus]|jgi:general secretion pathway protein M|uniref:General secretion pathway protein M n=1 Tax=Cupriavidus oxalaticus TaxID=96344 RepID=A0A375FV30_9BURK|nr:type II secretion system protein M [Cupriavidus oxalaticus]QRQ87566.1 type II secretion system protein M [Cupriavidus oxalaticus]QRQ94106.1 type II secretion system protein M [Cupriavidus oxalaticus]WQD82741.1 type II secretion system protein M [Cupriavidus oxalaticus]SPC10645.1 General secretion pathway protein M [Cupriavidus oxalaticus]